MTETGTPSIRKIKHGQYEIACRQPELLQHIPGLMVCETHAYGTLDAIFVAAQRIGLSNNIIQLNWCDATKQYTYDKLRPYQNTGVSWLVDRLRNDGAAILADDMGLGKTVQSIHAAKELKCARVLVICPGSVRETWRKEIAMWAGSNAAIITTGEMARNAGEHVDQWVVTSYELAEHINIQPDLVIIDEMQNVKGRKTKRGRTILELCTHASYRIGLTGTPMWSRPRDLWMLLKILFRYRFGNANDFDFAYCGAFINEWGGKVNKSATRSDELRKRLSYVMLRREKHEVARDMPELTLVTEWVEADKNATRLFQRALLNKQPGAVSDALKATLKAKIPRAVELAQDAGRFLIFTWMKEDAAEIHFKLNDSGAPCTLITGDQTHAQRQAAIGTAVANRSGVVATIDAAGVGVDGLQHVASIGIFHALDWVPIKMAQAVARLHRIGQKLPVHWTFLAMQESMDVLVIQNVLGKLSQWQQVMGGTGIKDMRDSLGDSINGAGAIEAEQAALRLLYEDM